MTSACPSPQIRPLCFHSVREENSDRIWSGPWSENRVVGVDATETEEGGISVVAVVATAAVVVVVVSPTATTNMSSPPPRHSASAFERRLRHGSPQEEGRRRRLLQLQNPSPSKPFSNGAPGSPGGEGSPAKVRDVDERVCDKWSFAPVIGQRIRSRNCP